MQVITKSDIIHVGDRVQYGSRDFGTVVGFYRGNSYVRVDFDGHGVGCVRPIELEIIDVTPEPFSIATVLIGGQGRHAGSYARIIGGCGVDCWTAQVIGSDEDPIVITSSKFTVVEGVAR
jgi:hypothetical protein